MKTVVLTTWAGVKPWSCKMMLTFCKTRSVCGADVPGDELARHRINRNLAGAKKEVAHAHPLTVRADGGSGAGRLDDCFGHSAIQFVSWESVKFGV